MSFDSVDQALARLRELQTKHAALISRGTPRRERMSLIAQIETAQASLHRAIEEDRRERKARR